MCGSTLIWDSITLPLLALAGCEDTITFLRLLFVLTYLKFVFFVGADWLLHVLWLVSYYAFTVLAIKFSI